MKWNKAIEQIESAMSNGDKVTIEYHIKYNPKQRFFDTVQWVQEFNFDGKKFKTIQTYYDGLDDFRNIIDNIDIA